MSCLLEVEFIVLGGRNTLWGRVFSSEFSGVVVTVIFLSDKGIFVLEKGTPHEKRLIYSQGSI
jgi:hypothetical protein